MKLIVGLGNPGKKYEANRHNIGFMILDAFAMQQGVGFANNKRLESDIANIGKHRAGAALLIKPQNYMNNSGLSIKRVLNFYQLQPSDMLVLYDELALPFGTLRIRNEGSSAGHNGVASIIEAMGDKFWRIRFGIANEYSEKVESAAFVLSDFNKDEKSALPALLDEIIFLIEQFIATGKLEPYTKRRS
jgi:PTH1 family peptidyl-tRNA hydrolase